ncbi:MAG: chromate transporter [Clostridiaceae bacterium]|nr:chromate transporter [Feifaniaceae bacterium]
MTYLLLFLEFFQTGLFSVGGGYATLPFLQKIMERYPDWFGSLQLADIAAIAEATPGPVGVNAATFAGYSAAGVPGALIATFALVLPSFIIVSLIARALEKYRQNKLVNDVFSGLRPAVTGLIAAAGWSVIQASLITGAFSDGLLAAIDWKNAALFAVLFVLMMLPKLKNIHPVFFFLIGGVAGALLGLI